jgi:hypothetical protein
MIQLGDETVMFSVNMLSKKYMKTSTLHTVRMFFFINHVKNTMLSDYVFTEGVFFEAV